MTVPSFLLWGTLMPQLLTGLILLAQVVKAPLPINLLKLHLMVI